MVRSVILIFISSHSQAAISGAEVGFESDRGHKLLLCVEKLALLEQDLTELAVQIGIIR